MPRKHLQWRRFFLKRNSDVANSWRFGADIDMARTSSKSHEQSVFTALKHVAGLLAQNCRGPNLVDRLGGEEFVALLEDAGASEAWAAAERLRSCIEQSPVTLHRKLQRITVSVGLSLIVTTDREFDDVLRRADKALYTANSAGRNRVETEFES